VEQDHAVDLRLIKLRERAKDHSASRAVTDKVDTRIAICMGGLPPLYLGCEFALGFVMDRLDRKIEHEERARSAPAE